jgi:pyruvate formate-lyase activating enzyme-like uncharacterized protein
MALQPFNDKRLHVSWCEDDLVHWLAANLGQGKFDASAQRADAGHFERNWQEHLARVAEQVPGATVQSSGESVFCGKLSPGCKACKEGTWDCIFITQRCNLNCPFCTTPHGLAKDQPGSAFGASPTEVLENYARTRIHGIAFSGGEAFLEPDRLFEWLEILKARRPHDYCWVYTNGLLAAPALLRALGRMGLDEIRFNMAATGYDCRPVLRHLEVAATCIPRVAVEIPAIAGHGNKLLAGVSAWSAMGVTYLNLHELMRERGSNSQGLRGAFETMTLVDGHQTDFCSASRRLTLAVMGYVEERNLSISVNDCSSQSKLRQLRGRRRSLAPLTRRPCERLIDDTFFESVIAWRTARDYGWLHPEAGTEFERLKKRYRLLRVRRTAPLSIYDPGRWILIQPMNG